MNSRFQHCSDVIVRLTEAIDALERRIASFELPPLKDREWFELLQEKVRPQLGKDSFLIVAVVGGTNIGKSVLFNHIAGGRLSATSPMASGTKHPTVLFPTGFEGSHNIEELFPGFELLPWADADQALREDDRHLLFWRESESLPSNLVVLDTPDVDSVAEVNWERADKIRRSADVLVAVLTQQKYNDAAVKQFFRKASQESKFVIVVFNQVLLPDDEEYWPLWMQTFHEETKIHPRLLYLAPNDRRAAEENVLPFYERSWPQEGSVSDSTSRDLLKDLSELRFSEIKVQTLQGALQSLCDIERGIPGWLNEIGRRGSDYEAALELMSSQRLVEVDHWPTLPNAVMIRKIREWWSEQREGWSAKVHGFYNKLGAVVTYPIHMLQEKKSPEDSPIYQYKVREWETILQALDKTFEKLTWLRDLGNPLLSPRLTTLLSGNARHDLIEKVRAEHASVDLETELSALVQEQLARFRTESPQSYRLFRRIDSVAAAARPAVSVALFMTGAGPVGNALFPAVADSAMQGALHIAGDAVGGTVMTAVGDKVLTEGASTSAGYLEARFRQLHSQFTKQRAGWLAQELEKHLFGTLPNELAASSQISQCPEFQRVDQLVEELRRVATEQS
ncbi:GTPase [Thalassoglobus sp.]|uniref:GTPase n=1 Tax=Thalassoglobus sp. TaxID=2795869 RepID=UPI003AA91B0A